MLYLSNNDAEVQAFPLSHRAMEHDFQARLSTEYNLTNIINRIVDNKCYVISDNQYSSDGKNIGITRPSDTQHHPLELNILGYYYKINYVEDVINLFEYPTNTLSNGDCIYANIYLTSEDTISNGTTYTLQACKGIAESGGIYSATAIDDESTGKFCGIGFTSEKVEADNVYSFPIIRKDVESSSTFYRIPDESKLRLMTDDTECSIRIWDGEL